MGLIESFVLYFPSIVFLWCFFLASIFLFSRLYKRVLSSNKRFAVFFANFVVSFPVAFIVGVRSYSVGVDTIGNYQGFLSCGNYGIFEALTRDATEILFSVVRWVFYQLTNGNAQVFFFFIGETTILFVLYAIENAELKYGGSALFVFYACYGPILMNQSRQLLAVSIVLFAVTHLKKRRLIVYLLLSVLASLIHLSAAAACAIIFALYWFENKRSTVWRNAVFYCFVIAIVLAIKPILSSLGNAFRDTKYIEYFSNIKENKIGLGLLLAMIPTTIPAIIFQKQIKDNFIRDNLIFVVPTRLSGYYVYFVYRSYYFFAISNVIAFPLMIENATTKNRFILKLASVLFCLVFFAINYVWANDGAFFPYSTIFRLS